MSAYRRYQIMITKRPKIRSSKRSNLQVAWISSREPINWSSARFFPVLCNVLFPFCVVVACRREATASSENYRQTLNVAHSRDGKILLLMMMVMVMVMLMRIMMVTVTWFCVCVILCFITRDGRHDVKRISSCQCDLTPSHSLGESLAALSRFRLTIKWRREKRRSEGPQTLPLTSVPAAFPTIYCHLFFLAKLGC